MAAFWDRPAAGDNPRVGLRLARGLPLSIPDALGVAPHLPHAQRLCWFQPGSGHRGSQGAFPLLSARAEDGEEASSPLGELQEAVEMLNDAAKERERVMEVAAETESLERLVGDGDKGGFGDTTRVAHPRL